MKYYWFVYLIEGPTIAKFQYIETCRNYHPFDYMKELAAKEKLKNPAYETFRYVLINWKEITEEEFSLFSDPGIWTKPKDS